MQNQQNQSVEGFTPISAFGSQGVYTAKILFFWLIGYTRVDDLLTGVHPSGNSDPTGVVMVLNTALVEKHYRYISRSLRNQIRPWQTYSTLT